MSPFYRLFEGYGIELEYMLVHNETLDVAPLAAELLRDPLGNVQNEMEMGPLRISNELVCHVIELKTNGVASDLNGLDAVFQGGIRHCNHLLAAKGCRLLPGGMHPWMDPAADIQLWPFAGEAIYRAYDRIFSCRTHGFANVQSAHLNLPFFDDAEFVRLHAAVRLLLPLLPALCASSPFQEGTLSGMADTRLAHYRNNQNRIPVIAGSVIPETVLSIEDYHARILEPIAAAVRPFDPESVFEAEWLNSRGAIARFERQAIEIRLLDIQECPRADLALMSLVIAVLRDLLAGRHASLDALKDYPLADLVALYQGVLQKGGSYGLITPTYLKLFGLPDDHAMTASAFWCCLMKRYADHESFSPWREVWDLYARSGCLAERLEEAFRCGQSIKEIARELADCLAEGRLFGAQYPETHSVL